ncbi:collagen-binding domain-containing protein [Lactobacillus hamsteri]|uniref:collagen-binding domain-containing protein n=1 Tax=Lactobacillus hamsteri TaxID=96565 RepID=UPI000468D082|nr:collagen-binding domain-containing protein [Lactobacillus hamsteri]
MSIKGREIKKVGIATIVTFTCLSTLSSMNLTSVQAAEQAGQSQAAPATNGQASQATSSERTDTQRQEKGSEILRQQDEEHSEQATEDLQNLINRRKGIVDELENNSSIHNDEVIGEKSKELNRSNDLGIASGFHIFSHKVDLTGSHMAGNVATEELNDNPNFGTNNQSDPHKNNTKNDVDYVGKITSKDGRLNLNGGAFTGEYGNHVVLGSNYKIEKGNDAGHIIISDGVNTATLDKRDNRDIVIEEGDKPYIDIQGELDKLSLKSEAWSKHADSKGSAFRYVDNNSQIIDVSKAQPDDDNNVFINVDASKLNNLVQVKGLSVEKDAPTVIINVIQPKGNKSYSLNAQVKLEYTDGTTEEAAGNPHKHENHVLWNFGTDLTSLTTSRVLLGSVLAPKATINVQGANIDGNIVGNEVIIGAETHRWDLISNPKHNRFPYIPRWEFPSEYHPSKPGKDKPGKPSEDKPSKPGKDKPGKPSEDKPSKPDKDKPGKPSEDKPSKPGKDKPGNAPRTPSHEEEVPPTPETPNQPSDPNTPPNVPDDFVPEKEATFTYSFAHSHGQDFKDGQKSESKKESYTRTVRDKADTVRTVTTVGAKTVDFPKDNVVVSGKTKTNNNNVVNIATKVVSTNSNNELPKTGANAGWMASLIGFATFALGAIGLKLNKKNR